MAEQNIVTRKWWETKSWKEMEPTEQISAVLVWAVIAGVAGYFLIDPKNFGPLASLLTWPLGWWACTHYMGSKGKGAWARHLAGLFGGFVAFLIVAVVLMPKPEKPVQDISVAASAAPSSIAEPTQAVTEQKVAAPVPEVVVEEKAPASRQTEQITLGLAPGDFAKRFDAHMAKLGKPWRLKKPRIESGAVNDTFTHSFSDRMAMTGFVSKNGELKSLMIFASGDGSPQSGVDIMLMISSAYAAVQGMDDLKVTGPEVLEVIKAQEEKGSTSRVLNGVKLFYSRNEVMGNFFGIEPDSL